MATATGFKRRIRVGTIDTGYASRAVVTIDVDWNGNRLSMTGTAQRPRANDIDQGGQMEDTIATMTDLVIPRGERDQLVAIWRRWHLNDLRAGCEHQRALGWMPAQYGTPEHEDDCVGKPCPVCGYKYGTAWLREDVPADVLDYLSLVGEPA